MDTLEKKEQGNPRQQEVRSPSWNWNDLLEVRDETRAEDENTCAEERVHFVLDTRSIGGIKTPVQHWRGQLIPCRLDIIKKGPPSLQNFCSLPLLLGVGGSCLFTW